MENLLMENLLLSQWLCATSAEHQTATLLSPSDWITEFLLTRHKIFHNKPSAVHLTQSLPCPRGLSVYSYSTATETDSKNTFSETRKKQKVHFPLTNINKKIIFTSTAEFDTKIPHTLQRDLSFATLLMRVFHILRFSAPKQSWQNLQDHS